MIYISHSKETGTSPKHGVKQMVCFIGKEKKKWKLATIQ